jgi:phosphoesterase RecJ-like protein
MPQLIPPDEMIEHLRRGRRIALTTHARADGDALACLLAMARVLRHDDRVVTALLHEPVASRYAFVPDAARIEFWNPAKSGAILGQVDTLLIVDTCAASQMGQVADLIRGFGGRRLAIDHHVTRDDIVEAALVDETAGACAVLIGELIDAAGWPLDADTATLLYTGMATDTGWFRFSNADRRVYESAARMISAGARPNELYEKLYLAEPEPRARLMGAVLSSFELHAEGRVAVIRVSQALLDRCRATREMTEDLINEPQRLGSVVACAMIVEPHGDDPVRISLRSKRGVDVSRIAAGWGGGGHARAAGARRFGRFETIADEVTEALVSALP